MIFSNYLDPVGNKNFEFFGLIPNVTKVTSPSVQKISLSQFICNSLFRRADIFTESVAATSSILGIVMYFKGATLDFPIIKQQCILPVSSAMHKYEACPYAHSQASAK